jgi:hypothetical protein
MQMTSKSMLIILGICMGLIFYGINVSLINFNRLVAPEQPLALLNWLREGEELKINLMGETIRLSLDNACPDYTRTVSTWLDSADWSDIKCLGGAWYRIGRDEIGHRLAPVRQKVREVIDWPSK